MNRIIDSHIHLDLIFKQNRKRIAWLKENNCSCISWAFGTGINSIEKLKHYLHDQKRSIYQIQQNFFECHFLTGIHPRNIPPDLQPYQVKSILLPHLNDDLCLGIGEIGLETGSEHEKEILYAQLELAKSLDLTKKVIGIHTPRNEKIYMTDVLIKIFQDFKELKAAIIIDHCSEHTIFKVQDCGYTAGVSLSPVKTSFQTLLKIINNPRIKIDKIMCNSDSGTRFFEDLVLNYNSIKIDAEVKAKLFLKNATAFYHLK